MSDVLAPDFKNTPYWWDAAAPEPAPETSLRSSYDVAIVGSGYTGLRAALTLLRAGRSVVVFETEDPGHGASRRNAGFMGRVLKKSFSELKETKGLDQALAVYRELNEAYQSTIGFIEEEGIDCHAVRCGRFVGATSAAHLKDMEAEYEVMRRHLGFEYRMISRDEQHQEMATDLYCGGAVVPDLGSLHPGLYHKGLYERALAAGLTIAGRTEVKSIERASGSFKVVTSRSTVAARDVIVATNGYTPRHLKWHSRRVVPFTGYMAATEVLSPELLAKAIPHRRTIIDSNVNIDFFRPAPDTSRILFGGATGCGLVDVNEIAVRLHGILARALPDLAQVKLSHVWTGLCAGTFDMMPHIGQHDGIWYGLGYNFAGVPMGSYFGKKLAQKVMGLSEGNSVFEESPFPTLPFYTGNPWFVPMTMRYFDWKDRKHAARAM